MSDYFLSAFGEKFQLLHFVQQLKNVEFLRVI